MENRHAVCLFSLESSSPPGAGRWASFHGTGKIPCHPQRSGGTPAPKVTALPLNNIIGRGPVSRRKRVEFETRFYGMLFLFVTGKNREVPAWESSTMGVFEHIDSIVQGLSLSQLR